MICGERVPVNCFLIWNKGTAFEATLHNNCEDEVYLQLKGDMMNLKT